MLHAQSNWTRVTVDTEFYGESADFADIDKDGDMDIVSTPFWYEGPDWKVSHRFRTGNAMAGNLDVYGGAWQTETYDFNGDGWVDILVNLGPCCGNLQWYQNPGNPGTATGNWTARTMMTTKGNESPHLGNVTGDSMPEYIVMSGNRMGVAEANRSNPTGAWTFRGVGEVRSGNGNGAYGINAHGIGAGDLNMDGRVDLMSMHGWYEQPANLQSDWTFHEAPFSARPYAQEMMGGAQMYAYDVDGDGDNDVVAAIQAHAWGLHWVENLDGEGGDWKSNKIMGTPDEVATYGVAFSQPHNLDIADIDGDGILDLVAGKRWGTHGPDQDNSARVIYWFEVKRTADGVKITPHLIDDHAGAGTQIVTGDLNGDRKIDVLVAGRRGTYALINGLPVSTFRPLAWDFPYAGSRGGLSLIRSGANAEGNTLHLRVLQPGFHHALSIIEASGRERTFHLGPRRAGEVLPLDIGRLPAGKYLLRAIRDGEPQNLGPLNISR
jgi:hypothetical protein